jgi:hypothetical protein
MCSPVVIDIVTWTAVRASPSFMNDFSAYLKLLLFQSVQSNFKQQVPFFRRKSNSEQDEIPTRDVTEIK